ncbi:MAG: EamA family transporter [Solidesulfovibrio sp.]
MTSASQASRKVFIGLTLAILLDTGLQIFWKVAVTDMPDQPTLWQTMLDMLHQPVFLLVGLFMAGQAFNWIAVLDHADLSYAHAITSLSYVFVAVLSVMYLGEFLDFPQVLGIVLILIGVWFVGISGHASVAVADEAS